MSANVLMSRKASASLSACGRASGRVSMAMSWRVALQALEMWRALTLMLFRSFAEHASELYGCAATIQLLRKPLPAYTSAIQGV